MTGLTLISVVIEHSTSNHVTTPKVRQIWSNLTALSIGGSSRKIGTILCRIVIALHVCTHNTMTGCAARLSKDLGPLLFRATSCWSQSSLLLRTKPGLKVISAVNDDIESHVCMLD